MILGKKELPPVDHFSLWFGAVPIHQQFSRWAGEEFRMSPDMPIPVEIERGGAEAWDERLRGMVALVGAEKVWEVGSRCLGYPATWACTNEEIDAIDAAIMKSLGE